MPPERTVVQATRKGDEMEKHLTRASKWLIFMVGCLGAFALAFQCRVHPPVWSADLAVFILLASVSSFLKVRLYHGMQVSVSYCFVFMALLILGPTEAMLCAAVGGVTSVFVMPHRHLFPKLTYNTATLILSATAAGLAYEHFGRNPWPFVLSRCFVPILVATFLYYAVNTVLITAVISLTGNRGFLEVYVKNTLWIVPSIYAGSSIAVIATLIAATFGIHFVFTIFPLLYLVYYSYKIYTNKIEEIESAYKKLKQTQNQLLQSEKLASLGILASGVAHEINNPLQGILGTAEALLHEDSPDIVREYTDDIIKYSREAAQIIQELSSLSKGARKETVSPTCVKDAVRDALRMSRHTTNLAGVRIEEEYQPVPELNLNPGELQQVLVNLIKNAVQAMQGEDRRLNILVAQCGENVEINLTDNGCGIPDENLKNIFDPFFTTKDAGQGTGLGLSIVYRIVTKYGGDIRVTSRVGKGSTFSLFFPVTRENAQVA
jgi:signal transduction histidine kinase